MLCSLAIGEWWLYVGEQAAFYSLPARWWELGAGALVAWTPGTPRRYVRLEFAAGISLVLLAMAFPTSHFPGIGALPAAVGATLLIHALISPAVAWKAMTSSAMLLVGRLSYPLYLWHWPILALASVTISGEVPAMVRIALVFAALLLAVATRQWIELPVRHRGVLHGSRLVAAAVVACASIAIVTVEAGAYVSSIAIPNDLASRTARDIPSLTVECENRAYSPVRLPNESLCTLAGHGPITVAIWGDSHAMSLQPLATAIASRADKTAMAYTRELCPPAVGFDSGEAPRIAMLCKSFNETVLKTVYGMDTVILAARWPPPAERGFGEDLIGTLDKLSPHVRRIIIVGATPEMPSKVPQCVRAGDLSACTQKRADFLKSSASVRAFLSSLADRYPKVRYVDPIAYLCDVQECPPVRDGIGLYFDKHHLTVAGAEAFAKSVMMASGKGDL